MRQEVHVHADIPILEGVSRKQLEQAFAPWLEYLDADSIADVKSLEAEEPGIRFDEKELLLLVCWTGEIGRSFHAALQATLDNLGPYCFEVDVTLYHENGEQEAKLLFVGPTAQAIHEAQRRCMIEDVTALLERQFDKERIAEVSALVNQLFDREWQQRGGGDGEKKKPERAFEYVTRPGRKNLH
jgi:hypothetical protein